MKLLIKIISSEKYLINDIINNILLLTNNFKFKCLGPIHLPTHSKRYDLLNSPFSDKDSRLQIKIITRKVLITILSITKSLIKRIMAINISPLVYIFISFKNE